MIFPLNFSKMKFRYGGLIKISFYNIKNKRIMAKNFLELQVIKNQVISRFSF